jgi:tetratricopeptide (TPR) repeat protein
MKYPPSNTTFNFYALCRPGIVLALLASLAACADNQPTRVEAQARPPVKLTPVARADFVVAMQSIKSVEYEKAIRYFNKVIAQSPNNPVPYINLALVHKKMQNLTLAEESLKLAIKMDPDNPVANNEYALLYRKTGRFTEARQVYERILEKYPNFIMAHKNLGILCDIYMRDYACALKHYTVYGSFRPDDAAVKIWIADMKGK